MVNNRKEHTTHCRTLLWEMMVLNHVNSPYNILCTISFLHYNTAKVFYTNTYTKLQESKEWNFNQTGRSKLH